MYWLPSCLRILIWLHWCCASGLFSLFVCAYFQMLTSILNKILRIFKGYKTKFKRKMAILFFMLSGYRLDWKCNPEHHITSSVVSLREKRCKMMLLLLLLLLVLCVCALYEIITSLWTCSTWMYTVFIIHILHIRVLNEWNV